MLTGYLAKIQARGKAEGFAEGEQMGSAKRAESIACDMLKAGFPSETVLKLTQVDPDTLEELKTSLKDG